MRPPRLPKRRPDSHKGDYGTVLVVAGSRGMMGAAVLASQGALRAGAGLAVLVVPETLVPVAMSLQVCATVRGVEDTGAGALASAETILDLPGDVVVAGPGLGRAPETQESVRALVRESKRPLVLDADALLPVESDVPKILTPHPGEMARLLGRPVKDREADAKEAARRFRAVVVLKGHRTVVTDGGRVSVNPTGNPGMATGGSGDVLAGVIGGLVAQRRPLFEAAQLGAWVHGRAGDLAAREKGQTSLIATDVVEFLPKAFRSVEAR